MARDPYTVLLALDWTPITVALITLSGVLIQLAVAAWLATHVRTPSKKTLGQQVEDTNHNTITNAVLLRRIALELGVKADDPELRALLEQASQDG